MIRKIALFLFLLLLVFSLDAFSQEQAISPLEQALSGILTIGVFKTTENDFVMGFSKVTKSYAEIAYEQTLQMGEVFSSGSGFVIEIDGKYYILTNAHVIKAAAKGEGAIYAYSIQRTRYPLRLVGGDSFYDIAILEFDGAPGPEVQALQFSEQEARFAQKVYAIGNPLGKYPYSITEGIVSGKNRLYDRPTTGRFGFLQHTAALIWGNSGGPLVDEQGRVVGINTWIGFHEKGGQSYRITQLNFALEGQKAARLARNILANGGRLKRAFMGIELASADLLNEPGLSGPPFINAVLEHSPAYAALKDLKGATLTHINGGAVPTLQDAVRILESIVPGDSVRLTLKRTLSTREISVPTSELGPNQLEQIAQHFFRSYTDYGLSENAAGVLLDSAKGKPQIQQFESAGVGDSWAKFNRIEGKANYGLGALGSMSKQGNLEQYQAKTIQEVGAIIRICAIEGSLGATLVHEGRYAGTVGFFMRDEDWNDIRLLYY
jgi:S1-C subfamily serine protease